MMATWSSAWFWFYSLLISFGTKDAADEALLSPAPSLTLRSLNLMPHTVYQMYFFLIWFFSENELFHNYLPFSSLLKEMCAQTRSCGNQTFVMF